MAIEFRCTGCQQQLRVPDDSAGKSAKCPKCGSIVVVPAPNPTASNPFVGAAPPAGNPLGAASPTFGANPFGGGPADGANPFGAAKPAGGLLNPYASPQAAVYQPPMAPASAPIVPQVISVDQVFNHAWQVWQINLGLLVGVTFAVIVISWVFGFLLGMLQVAILQSDAPPEVMSAVDLCGQIAANALQLYLGIGQVQVALKLARRQPANFSDLFAGGPRFLPVLGVYLLLILAVGAGLVLLIVPGIILLLMWWPAYYLVVDGKAGIIEAFSVAGNITKGNWGTAIVLWLLNIVIVICGFLLLCIGLLFALPLASLVWATAYLMMSGQIATYGATASPAGSYAPQPMPGK
jgi:uncharacterized membrane protein